MVIRRHAPPFSFALILLLAGYLMGLATAWVIISSPRLNSALFNLDPYGRQMLLFWEAWDIVQDDFVGELPDARTMTYGAIRGALATLNDPYSVFVEPQAHQRETEDLQGKFGGIGVTMQRDEQGRVLLSPMADAPAVRAGVQQGDILTLVESAPITPAVSFEQIASLVRGPVGTPVTIQVQRGQPPLTLTFTIVREEIVLPSATWRLIEDKPYIGYVALSRFSERTNDELVQGLAELRDKGALYLILDLRDNGGGLREAAVQVASQFLSDGVVMYQRRKSGEESLPVIGGGVATDLPLVVLVNRGTASAAEIVAGALQDHQRAQLIGEQTFGKGSVQHIHDLRDGSSVHVTTAEWLTPNRRQLRGRGLAPDVVVTQDGSSGRDLQLAAAIEWFDSDK